MLESPNIPQIGVAYFPASSRRQRMARRRLYVVAALAGLALASGVAGMLTAPRAQPLATDTYLPVQ
ncbi:hypothetical protein [Phenylobacterium sp.]|jgi:hypothetical protein|uniref:hypothetical protein n=1 Tax=Phenylobacterium sp. TaxID=1871053 RepID=UPI002F3FDA16